MLVYKDDKDVIESVKRHIDKKMAACDRTISANKANSHATMRAMAERAAYEDVRWLMTKYTFSDAPEPEPEPTTQVVP